MATSGQTISQLNRDQIINSALRKIGVLGEGDTANADQLSKGQEALNVTLLTLMTFGMSLWKRSELPITMVTGQPTYTIGEGLAIDTPFPTKVLQATMEVAGNNSQIDMEIKARYDFNLLPTNSQGTPVSVSYQPFVNYGVLSVWPTPDASLPAGSTVTLTYQEPFDLFTTGTETPDFPQEWQQALIYTLALTLADENGLPLPDKQWMEKQADKFLAMALSFGTEEGSITFYPSSNC